jgi:hypothetical protein
MLFSVVQLLLDEDLLGALFVVKYLCAVIGVADLEPFFFVYFIQ